MLDNHGKVAIAQLVLYSPAFVFCLWSFIRDGFGRGNGWIYLLTFCASKIRAEQTQFEPNQRANKKQSESPERP